MGEQLGSIEPGSESRREAPGYRRRPDERPSVSVTRITDRVPAGTFTGHDFSGNRQSAPSVPGSADATHKTRSRLRVDDEDSGAFASTSSRCYRWMV